MTTLLLTFEVSSVYYLRLENFKVIKFQKAAGDIHKSESCFSTRFLHFSWKKVPQNDPKYAKNSEFSGYFTLLTIFVL